MSIFVCWTSISQVDRDMTTTCLVSRFQLDFCPKNRKKKKKKVIPLSMLQWESPFGQVSPLGSNLSIPPGKNRLVSTVNEWGQSHNLTNCIQVSVKFKCSKSLMIFHQNKAFFHWFYLCCMCAWFHDTNFSNSFIHSVATRQFSPPENLNECEFSV